MTRIHQDVRLIEQMETLFLAGSLGGLSDGALLDRFQARDASSAEAAFAELVRRHGPMVLGTCRRILVDPHLAEDALQATFLVLARRAGSVRNREALGGWLHRVACRIAWRARKRSDRRRAKEEPMVEEIAAKAVDCAEGDELRAIVDQEIDRLRDIQRLPVVLCCLQGLSHEEASERLRLPLGTVKSRLARGREKLQERLIRRGVAPAMAAAALTGGTPSEAAALSTALVKSTAAMAGKAGFGGVGTSAAIAALVSEELGSVLAIKLKVGSALVLGGLAVGAVGFVAPTIRSGASKTDPPASLPIARLQPARVETPPSTSGEILVRVVGQDGRPASNAEVRLLDPDPREAPSPGRTDAKGRYRTTKRDPSQSATLDVTSSDRLEGGTVEIPGADSPGKKTGEIEVRLRPVGSLSGRVLDENRAPLPGAALMLYRSVAYPERPGTSFGKPIETDGKAANDGGFAFKGLIPDATYYVHVEVGGHATATSRHVKIKQGEQARLDEIRLPATDQELTGIVVNPRGEPIAGASISYQHDGRDQALYAPQGAVWFQDTDAAGRFHLSSLPRGAKRLMAYRNEGTERNIRNLNYTEVAAGQNEVRIELPDVNERLRGIE